jgi:phytol kinase
LGHWSLEVIFFCKNQLMQQQLFHLLGLGAAYLALFGLCEWLHHRRHWQAEHTRKLAHAGSGLLALSFPFFFQDFWFVAVLCALFLLILAVTKYTGFLRSIHGIPRVSYGSAMFPIVVCICFWRYAQTQDLTRFYLPVLVMALADPAACIVGKRLPISKLFRKKTLGGSLAFFVLAFGLGLAMFGFLQVGNTWASALAQAAALGLATTFAEAVSGRGFDNLTIPLAALAVMR